MKDKELDEKIVSYFESKIPEPDMESLERIKMKMQEDSKPKKSIKLNLFWRVFVSVACVIIILIPCILIPILYKGDENNPNGPADRYYTESETQKVSLEDDFVKNYINQNFSQYNFIFEDCESITAYGFYAESNKLMAINLVMFIKEIYIDVEVNLIVDNHYTYSQDSTYRENTNITQFDGYKLYYKEIEGFYETKVYGLFEYDKYKTYVYLADIDENFFNKF